MDYLQHRQTIDRDTTLSHSETIQHQEPFSQDDYSSALALCADLGTNLKIYGVLKRAAKRLAKKARGAVKRTKILNELVQTERKFIEDMDLLTVEVKIPLEQNNLLSKQQSKSIFANLDAIIELNKTFLEGLEMVMKKYDKYKTMLSEHLMPYFPFFIIYSQFCNIYYEGDELLKNLRSQFAYIDNLISKKEKGVLGQPIDSFRIKPIQRIMKYQLFLRDYLKTMTEDHPDYVGVQRAIDSIVTVNQKNNLSLDRETRKYKSFEFEKKFGSQYEILNEKRQFKMSATCKLFGKTIKEGLVHLFSDLLLITDSSAQNLLAYIELDKHSYLERVSQTKYFKYLVFVIGSNCSVYLLFNSKKEGEDFYLPCRDIIKELKKRTTQRKTVCDVSPLSDLLNARVVYVEYEYSKFYDTEVLLFCIEYAMKGFRIRVKYTLERLIRIFDELKRHCKKIELELSSNDTGFFATKKGGTKINQYRRLMLQVQINNLFRNKDLLHMCEDIAFRLAVPASFMNYANVTEQKHEKQAEDILVRKAFRKAWQEKKKQKMPPSATDVINRLFYQHFIAPTEPHQSKVGKSLIIRVDFPQVDGIDSIRLKIMETDTVLKVLWRVTHELGMDFINDYCLYLEHEDSRWRLDFQDPICEIIGEDSDQDSEDGSFFKLIDRGFKKAKEFFSRVPARIVLRKYLYLPKALEMQLIDMVQNKENQRLRLMVEQLFYRFSKGQFLYYSNEKIARLAYYFLCIRDFANAMYYKATTLPIERLRKLLPNKLLERMGLSLWCEQVIKMKQSILRDAKPSQIYRQILSEFEGYQHIRFEGIFGKQRTTVVGTIDCDKLIIKDQEFDIEQVEVSWAPKSLFVFVGHREIRMDLQHAYSIAQTIVWYRTIHQLLNNLNES